MLFAQRPSTTHMRIARALHRAARGFARGASDPWMQVRALPEDALAALANVLEVRAAEPAQERIRQSVMADALIGAPAEASVCEVGCGTGAVSRYIASLPSVGRVIGVDPSPRFLERARQIGGESVEYVTGDGAALPLYHVAVPADSSKLPLSPWLASPLGTVLGVAVVLGCLCCRTDGPAR